MRSQSIQGVAEDRFDGIPSAAAVSQFVLKARLNLIFVGKSEDLNQFR